ncbi:MAG: hypothetical protein J2O46_00055 [Nocardioides sp.]|nr:hypothetical protein [Nocardioides sp.]
MTDRTLHDELARIADAGAPQARVPTDLYDRAVRLNRRSLMRNGLLATACLALVAGLAVFVLVGQPQHAVEPVGPVRKPAVPATIYQAPGWPAEASAGRHDRTPYRHADRMETGLRLGVSAAAYQVQNTSKRWAGPAYAVVVDGDGRYHLLDLPDFVGRFGADSAADAVLALSPDGRYLAWGWATRNVFGAAPGYTASGLRVADLTTGEMTTWDLDKLYADHNIAGYEIHTLGWSADSQRLVWAGDAYAPAECKSDANGDSCGANTKALAGSVTLGSHRVERWNADLTSDNGSTPWAISNGGAIAHLAGTQILVQQPGSAPVEKPSPGPSGTKADWSLVFRGEGLYAHTTLGGVEAMFWPGAAWSFPNPPVGTSLRGWVDDTHLMVQSLHAPYRVQLVSSDGSLSTRITLAPGFARASADSLTVAYDLIDPDEPGRAGVRPHFPAKPADYRGTAITIGTCLAVGLAIWRLRRRRVLIRFLVALAVLVGIAAVIGLVGLRT